MTEPVIETVALATISPYENNPRSRDRKQIKALARSIEAYGFNAPIVVDESGVIINGHGRYEAAKSLKLRTVPVVRVTHLSEAQKRAYRIADNRLGAMSLWDSERLAVEFEAILADGLELEISTAFDTADIDYHLDAANDAKGPDTAPEDRLPHAPGDGPRVSQLGDMWELGAHRLLCADARDAAAVERLMGGEQARMAFADPPYNVKIDGFAVGKGKHKHDDFEMAVGEMTPAAFQEFLSQSLVAMARVSHDGAILFCCMDWRHVRELIAAGEDSQLSLLNLIVWVKSNAGMGTFYRSRHELVCAFKKGTAAHRNNFGLGQHGRHRTNVWEYRGANAFGPTRDEDLAAHPTVKPAMMVADAIKDVSRRGEIVLDFFSGSGTTIIAAQMTGRRARAIELSPDYVDLAVRRWQRATGKKATLAGSGATFEDVEEARTSSANDAAGDAPMALRSAEDVA